MLTTAEEEKARGSQCWLASRRGKSTEHWQQPSSACVCRSPHKRHPSWYVAEIAADLRFQGWLDVPSTSSQGLAAGFTVLGDIIDVDQSAWTSSWFGELAA